MSARWYQAAGGFFCLPRALRYDDRLSHPDVHVLIAIASHVFLKDEVFPTRTSLRAYTSIQEENISRRTARLEEFGWLLKSGERGRKITYLLKVPAYAENRMKEIGSSQRLEYMKKNEPTLSTESQENEEAEEQLVSANSDDFDKRQLKIDFDLDGENEERV